MSISSFAQTQQRLLLAEHEDEIASSPLSSSTAAASASTRRALQQAGHALTGLVLTNCRTGMGGREVGEFSLDTALSGPGRAKGTGKGVEREEKGEDGARLGVHGITVGDIVRVEEISSGKTTTRSKAGKDDERSQRGLEGVVTRVGERSIWAAFGGRGKGKQDDDGVDELWGRKLWLVKLANDVTYRRMNQTMMKLEKMEESEYSQLIRVLFGHTTPSPLDLESVGPLEFMDPSLNDSQREAIRFALASREIALIHGPPGTGKTHTLIELIRQLVLRKKRILVCGPSNISVDNIVERLASHKVPLVRIGHPARLLSSVLDHSLEVLSQTSEAAAIVKDVRKEIDAKQASIRKTRNGRERRAIYGDLKELRKEFRERESKCVDNIVSGSQVVLGTLHGAGGHQLKNQKFDVVLIDEASQAREAQCWIPLLTASKVILAGDHLQLPPTIKSKASSKPNEGNSVLRDQTDLDTNELSKLDMRNLEITLFDRLLSLHGPGIKRMLNTQYRMHQIIMDFPSHELYESKLIAAGTVKERLLKDLPYEVEETDDTREPLIFYDTQGGDFPEKSPDSTGILAKSVLVESKCNDMEAAVVARHVEKLVLAGVRPDDIAVITPYNAQVALLSQLLKEKFPTLELGSVDGFQGREKEAVVVSLVRSNLDHEVGFLGEKRRLNVAMTRPRRHLCVCGDSETVSSGSHFLKRWLAFLEENADLRYPDLSEFTN
ncbi:putative DNA helicase [Microsporum ferrugineum]